LKRQISFENFRLRPIFFSFVFFGLFVLRACLLFFYFFVFFQAKDNFSSFFFSLYREKDLF